MKRITLCLIAFLLAAALCFALCSCGESKPVELDEDTKDDGQQEPDPKTDDEPDPEPEPEPVTPVTPDEPEPEPEPIPVEPDEPEPEPEPIPVEPDEPEPEPEPKPELPDSDIKGKLTSEQSKNLKLELEWAYLADTGKIKAIVSLRCSSIHVKAKYQSGSVKIGESTQSFSTPELINEVNEAKTFYFAELEFDAPDSTSIPISASWNFGGTYSGVPIDVLTVDGTIELA